MPNTNTNLQPPFCLQGLLEGLRANQTVSELNLSGCKLTDEGITVMASIIKASAASVLIFKSCITGLHNVRQLSTQLLLTH